MPCCLVATPHFPVASLRFVASLTLPTLPHLIASCHLALLLLIALFHCCALLPWCLEMACPVPWQNSGDNLRPRTCPGHVLKMTQDIYAKKVCGPKVICGHMSCPFIPRGHNLKLK